MLLEVIPPVATHTRFDYFDIVVLDWLILGLLRGRKSGMSRELVPLVQWIAIVTTAGAFYSPVGSVISQNTYLSPVWANVTAYLLIAAVIHLICLWIKRALAVKLVEWELFGPREYFFGMIAGMGRFACMLLFGLALMNSCIVPATQPVAVAKPQKIKPGLRFPTYGEMEQDVLSNSFSGTWVQSNLKPILIAGVKPPEPKLVPEKSGKIVTKVLASESRAGAVTKNSP
jgi:uncharacterized membrane protein required for colicin V production